MSNGIDNLATGAMTGNGPEVVYTGQDLAGPLVGSADAQNIDGAPQILDASNGYGQVLDSTNNLGVGGTIGLISSQTGN